MNAPRPDARPSMFSWPRFAVAALVGLLLSWVVVVNGVASIAGDNNPRLALRFAPYDATANAAYADRLLQSETSSRAQEDAATYARKAISRSLLSPVAVRILGFEAEARQNPDDARKLLTESAKLSRRDLGTSLWMINDAVERGDTIAALHHYDTAMRSSPVARAILFPILTSAIADNEFVAPMINVLKTQPNWSGEFVISALESGKATRNLATIVASSPHIIKANPPVAQTLIDALVREKQFEAAWRFHASQSGGARASELSDPRFTAVNALTPFGWLYASGADFGANRTDQGLELFANAGTGGAVASQLLLLKAGRYRLASVGRVQSGGAMWTVACAGNEDQMLARVVLPGRLASVQSDFVVPDGCAATWVRLVLQNDGAPDGVTGTVREIQVRQLAG